MTILLAVKVFQYVHGHEHGSARDGGAGGGEDGQGIGLAGVWQRLPARTPFVVQLGARVRHTRCSDLINRTDFKWGSQSSGGMNVEGSKPVVRSPCCVRSSSLIKYIPICVFALLTRVSLLRFLAASIRTQSWKRRTAMLFTVHQSTVRYIWGYLAVRNQQYDGGENTKPKIVTPMATPTPRTGTDKLSLLLGSRGGGLDQPPS